MQSGNPPGSVAIVGRQTAIFDRVEVLLRHQGVVPARFDSEDAFLSNPDALRGLQVLCAPGTLTLTRDLMTRASEMRGVVSPFTGVEGFDQAAATELGIVISNGSIAENYESMAESAVMLMLTCFYNLAAKQQALRAGSPNPGHHGARMMAGATIGLYGYGNIAKHVVKLLSGWDVRFLIATRTPPVSLPANAQHTDLETMLSQSDVSCVLAPLNDATRNILDYQRLSLAPRGAALVALSRGGVIDEDALSRLLDEGHFSNVAIDVFRTEPLPLDSPLRRFPNAILTPHSAGHTRESLERMPPACADSVLKLAKGRLPERIVNPSVLGSLRFPLQ